MAQEAPEHCERWASRRDQNMFVRDSVLKSRSVMLFVRMRTCMSTAKAGTFKA